MKSSVIFLAVIIVVTILLNGCSTRWSHPRVYTIFCDGKPLANNHAPNGNTKHRPYRKGDVMIYRDADNNQFNVNVKDCFLTVVEVRWRE